MIDFRHETFLTLCKIKNYTKTAQQLCITQPAVSQHIKYLEQLYGGKLFTYEKRKLTLTERGKQLYDFTIAVSKDSSFLRQSLVNSNTQKTSISFGATLSIGEYVMPQIMRKLLEYDLDIRLHMQVNNTHMLLDKLHTGDINFALLEGYFNKADYDWKLFSKEEFIAVCSPNAALAGREVQMADILGERLFIRENGSGTREIFEQILQEHNHTIKSFDDICVVGNMNAIKQLVQYNLGITFLYKVVAQQELKRGELVQINLRDFTVWRAFHFVFLKNSQHKQQYLDWYQRFLTRNNTKIP